MKTIRIAFLFTVTIAFLAVSAWWYISAEKPLGKIFDESEPDLPLSVKIDKERYKLLRAEQLGLWRGMDTTKQGSRGIAVKRMEVSEKNADQRRDAQGKPAAAPWKALGPAPIPVSSFTSYSGRVTAIAVHPTNPDIVYVGAAQGGLYRSLNGGTTWTPLLDSALSLSIGSIAIAPSDPTTVFVGTGEAALSADSFFGVGIYRITNADTVPVVSGPMNQSVGGLDIFTGRSVSKIIVHPTEPNILFASSASGTGGIGSAAGLILPNPGLFRTTNAMAAIPTFTKLTIQGTINDNRRVIDAAIEPGNPDRLLVAVIGFQGDGGVYLSTNALGAAPVFTRTLTTGDGSSAGRTEFAVNKVADVVTVYAASGTANGTLYKSIDGGATFNQTVANNFCNPQCFYDIAVAVDPNDSNKVYLGGSPTLPFGRSDNGGMSFLNSSTGLHVDTHAFAIAPSNPNILYFGSDGGIWKTTNVSATPITWTTLNNSTFSATQFQGISLHPTDRHYMLGGTQDNGTQFLAADGTTWVRSDGGDGGFSVIDQNSTSTTSVTAYHTYFNEKTTQIGFTRALTTEPNGDPIWNTFLGCQRGTSNNGINCDDNVLFYAPMVNGPGNPNTLYFGTNRLYRSTDKGTTMADASGVLPATISAIAIAPQSDDIRLVGLVSGRIFLSTTPGATTMTDVTGSIPPRYVGRIAIDKTNSNVAYVSLNGYGLLPGHHVWKTTNLLSGTPVWTAAGAGIPDVPVNTFAIDPENTQELFAGTDIGVFRSSNGGTSWEPFSDGLARVAVFGMEFHPVHRVLRIATHGRGVFEYNFGGNSTPFDYDGDSKADFTVSRPSNNIWYLLRGTAGYTAMTFGEAGDRLAPADYDGDGKTDVGVFRPSNGTWHWFNSSSSTFQTSVWGQDGDIPVPADRDNDGKADLIIYRPSNGTWYKRRSADGSFEITPFGTAEDKPQIGDFDGDGKADLVVFRPSNSTWYFLRTTAGFTAQTWGAAGDLPVPADYDGDGKTDVAVFRPSTGQWFRVLSTGNFDITTWGENGDKPVAADYDGDGKADLAVFRPSNATWYFIGTTTGIGITPFGTSEDRPTPNAFVY